MRRATTIAFLLVLTLATAAQAISDGGSVQATDSWYTTWVWDYRGEMPLPLAEEDIDVCQMRWTFDHTSPYGDWHYWTVEAEDLDAFAIDWKDHVIGTDIGVGQQVIVQTTTCIVYIDDEWIWTDGSAWYDYRTLPNIDPDKNCGFGQSDQAILNTYYTHMCSEYEEPELSECISTDYDRNGGVGQSDQSFLNLITGWFLCTDHRWIDYSEEECELLPWLIWPNTVTTSPPVPTDKIPATCE